MLNSVDNTVRHSGMCIDIGYSVWKQTFVFIRAIFEWFQLRCIQLSRFIWIVHHMQIILYFRNL